MHPNPTITRLFYLAGATNVVGILLFYYVFTRGRISNYSPRVFSSFGIVSIVIWGLAYLSVARSYQHVRTLIAVFSIEKLVYVITWLWWLFHHAAQLPKLYQDDPFVAAFFTLYGPLDLAFGLFFAAVACRENYVKISEK